MAASKTSDVCGPMGRLNTGNKLGVLFLHVVHHMNSFMVLICIMLDWHSLNGVISLCTLLLQLQNST